MASDDTTPRIAALAATISSSVAKLQELLSARGVPCPSFDEDNPTSLPVEASEIRDSVLDATSELHELLLEPLPFLFKSCAINNMVSFNAIGRLHIAEMVPPGGKLSVVEISRRTGLGEQVVQRLLRHAMAMRVFREPELGMVSHTKASKMLADPYVNDWLNSGAETMWPSVVKMLDALEKWPASQEPNETAFVLANGSQSSIYEAIGADPTRAAKFAGAMRTLARFPGYGIPDVARNYNWASLGHALIVDVGGSQGYVAIELANNFNDVSLVVQDMGKVIDGAEAGVPDRLKGRIRFMEHDLFEPQTVEADVYFFRMVFHNWADKYGVLILRAQIPALRPGAKILIQDACMPDPGAIPLWMERDLRAMDMSMGALFNSRERYLHEWKGLLAEADERFVLRRVIEPNGYGLAILEIEWNELGLQGS